MEHYENAFTLFTLWHKLNRNFCHWLLFYGLSTRDKKEPGKLIEKKISVLPHQSYGRESWKRGLQKWSYETSRKMTFPEDGLLWNAAPHYVKILKLVFLRMQLTMAARYALCAVHHDVPFLTKLRLNFLLTLWHTKYAIHSWKSLV